MRIKIHKENENGWAVYRLVGGKWKWWLPELHRDQRGDEYLCILYKHAAEAEAAARKAKELIARESDKILDI